jgi:hypothetical protein
VLLLGVTATIGDGRGTYPAMASIATWVLLPVGVLALLTGLALANLRTGSFRLTWVRVKLLATIALIVDLTAVGVPGLQEAADLVRGRDDRSRDRSDLCHRPRGHAHRADHERADRRRPLRSCRSTGKVDNATIAVRQAPARRR